MKFKKVMRRDKYRYMFRLCRFTWGGHGDPVSQKFSIALVPYLFKFKKGDAEWILTILGIRLHHSWSYGGVFAD